MKYILIAVALATVSINSVQARVHPGTDTQDIKATLMPSLHQLKTVAPKELKNNVQATINWFDQQGFINKQTLKNLEAQLRTLRKLNLQVPSEQQNAFDTSINGVIDMVEGLKSKLRWSWV